MLKKLTIILLFLTSYMFAQDSTEIKLGQKIEREITTSEKHTYKFTVSANQFTNIAVEQKGIDILLKLIAPSGTVIAEFDSPTGRAGTEETKAVLEQSGEYILEISVVERTKITGKYELNFAETRDANPNDIKRFQAIIAYQEGMKLRGQRTIPTLKQAADKFELAAKLMGELGDKKEQGIAISEKGLSMQTMGDYDGAIANYKAAISLFDEVKDYKNKSTSLNNIAFIKGRQSEYQDALIYLHLSLESAKISKIETATVLPLVNLATTYRTVGDLPRSIQYYNEALIVARKNSMKNSESAILMNLGLIYSDTGEHQKGLDMHLEILPYYKSVRDNSGEMNVLGYIADEYFYLKNNNEALNYFNQQLKLSQASNTQNPSLYAYFGLGKTYTALGDSVKALENLTAAQNLSRNDRNSLAQIVLWIGINKQKLGQLNEAKIELEKALEIVESIRNRLSSQELRTSYFSKLSRRIYEVYVSILMDLYLQTKNPEYQTKGFESAEKSKARSLLELLALSRVNIRQGVDANLLDEEKKLRKDLQDKAAQLSRLITTKPTEEKLKEAQNNYSKAEESLQQLEAKIRVASPHYAAITQLQTVSLAETQSLLDKDTVVMEFLLADNKSYLWLIGKDSISTIELPKRSEIEAKSRQYYELLTARNLKIKFETAEDKRTRIAKADAELPTVGNDLSQILLGSVKDKIANKKLIVISEGALQFIPFASLKINNRFLIETNELVNLPSASTLGILHREMANRKPAPKTIAVLADPVFEVTDERFTFAKVKMENKNVATRSAEIEDLNSSMTDFGDSELSLKRLPFTRQEAEKIAKLVPANQSKIALDFAATRQLALSDELNQYRIIHFAAHGFLNSKNPELSGLVFSLVDETGKPQNGFMRTDEVFNLKLSADLVVLSACKTGLGKDIRGEGLIGMTRGFMYAGASRVMVSYWDVNDEATAGLMTRFYQKHLGNKMSPSKSLREVQLAFLKDKTRSHPYYWAAFTLHGE